MQDKMQEKFLAVYEECSDGIFRYCLYRTFDKEVAADLTQEAFLRAWTAFSGKSEISNLKAFVYKIARNLIIDRARKKREMSLDALLEKIEFASPENPDTQVDARLLLDKLQELSDDQREVIIMRYIEGLTPAEIAEILEETPNAVSIRLNRALNRLKEIYK
jgi:RNA polymerase sigma-70 factor, ECF subfamily